MYQLKIQGDVHKKVERIRTAKIPTLGTPGRHQQRTYICVEAIPIEIVDVELRCCFRIEMNYNALQGTITYPTPPWEVENHRLKSDLLWDMLVPRMVYYNKY